MRRFQSMASGDYMAAATKPLPPNRGPRAVQQKKAVLHDGRDPVKLTADPKVAAARQKLFQLGYPAGRSTTGFCIMLAGAAITSVSRRQHCITMSSCEAELVALADCAIELISTSSELLNLSASSMTVRSRRAATRRAPVAAMKSAVAR